MNKIKAVNKLNPGKTIFRFLVIWAVQALTLVEWQLEDKPLIGAEAVFRFLKRQLVRLQGS